MITLSNDSIIVSDFWGRNRFAVTFDQIVGTKSLGRSVVMTLLDGSTVEPQFPSRKKADSFLSQLYEFWIERTQAPSDRIVSDIDVRIGILLGVASPDITSAVDTILDESVRLKASDIHFKRLAECISVLFRIDGIFYDLARIPIIFFDRIVSRIKVMADLPIYKTKIVQDGKIVRGGTEMRVSFMPAAKGEQLVIRVFHFHEDELSLDSLGLQDHSHQALKKVLGMKDGIVVFTGPSSSGKTTAMYSLLKDFERSSVKDTHIITLEDPVEFDLQSIMQVNVDEESGFTFSDALKAVLRQDPEIIMIGEIRDSETVKTAFRAGLTGHLVITTVHAGSVREIFPRLFDMGVEPYLMSTIRVVSAHRLLRALCPNCKQEYLPDDEERALLKIQDSRPCFRPGRCLKCFNTGYTGRLPVTEVLEIDDTLRGKFKGLSSKRGILSLLETIQIPTLLDSALSYATQGLTSLDEVRRVIGLK